MIELANQAIKKVLKSSHRKNFIRRRYKKLSELKF